MWIVLELWPDLKSMLPCMDEDGNVMVFEEYQLAEDERANCQDGLIIPIAGIGRRRLEALTEVKRMYPMSDIFDAWSLSDLEKACSDLRRIVPCAT